MRAGEQVLKNITHKSRPSWPAGPSYRCGRSAVFALRASEFGSAKFHRKEVRRSVRSEIRDFNATTTTTTTTAS
jgi:hypothetical protein